MHKTVRIWNEFLNAYKSGFNNNVMTVVLYFLFSSMWIYGSDHLLIMLFRDPEVISSFQTIKGLAFVICSSLLLMVLLYNNYSKAITAQKDIEVKLIEGREDIHNKADLYDLMSGCLLQENTDVRELLINIFHTIYSKVPESNYGSVYMVSKDKVEFIDAVGYDLASLNSVKMDPEKFEMFTFGLRKNEVAEQKLEKKLGPEKYAQYSKHNPKIHESIYIGLTADDDIRVGLSFDISQHAYENTMTSFSQQTIQELKDLQLLLTAMFRMKTNVGIKNILQKDIVNSFIAALEYHDEYTKGHSDSVANISTAMGKKLGLNSDELRELKWAAMIHDIGKITVKKSVLNKNGKLTNEEYEQVKQHSIIGEDFLSKSDSLADIARIVRHHHERWDGGGYPDGLRGKDIPQYSRIICVADAYHAMTSDRPYRKALPNHVAIDEIKKNRETQFCPDAVDCFLALYN